MHDPAVPVSEPTAPQRGPLRLDAPREEILGRAAEIVADAWRSFDRFRPGQPPVDDGPDLEADDESDGHQPAASARG